MSKRRPESRPNFHDDPRLEVPISNQKYVPRSELDNRLAKRGSDLGRLALGLEPNHGIAEKVAFESEEARLISSWIENSAINEGWVKGKIQTMIMIALNNGEISKNEASGLSHYLEHAEGLSDEPSRYPDARERQTGNK